MLYVHVVINVTCLIIILWTTIGIKQGTLYSWSLLRAFWFFFFAFFFAFSTFLSSHHLSNVGLCLLLSISCLPNHVHYFDWHIVISCTCIYVDIKVIISHWKILKFLSKTDQKKGIDYSQEKLLQVVESHFRILDGGFIEKFTSSYEIWRPFFIKLRYVK